MAQQDRNRENGKKGGRPPGPPREKPPRNRPGKTQSLTHLGSQVGSDDNENGPRKPAQKAQSLTHLETQVATQRDGSGRVPSLITSSLKEQNQKKPGKEQSPTETFDEYRASAHDDVDPATWESKIRRNTDRMYDS
jgi:hypothetical protein